MKRFFYAMVAMVMMMDSAAQSATTASAKDTIESFYKAYIAQLHKPRRALHPAFSKAFTKAQEENGKVCEKYAKGDICGWGADGDPYIDAQDFDNKLTYENSQITYREDKPGTVTVSLNLFPSDPKLVKESTRTITYKMVQEDGHWVIDDVMGDNGKYSARKAMADENASFRKGN